MPGDLRLAARARPALVALTALALAAGGLLPSPPKAGALPPGGTDTLSVIGQVSVVSLIGSETIDLYGTASIQRSDPRVDGGVEVVDAEIVSLDLEGESLTGPITVSESATFTSPGEIRSLQPSPGKFPASSFFDVFIVVEAPASPAPTVTLHTEVPLRLVPMSGGSEVSLTGWPPVGVSYRAEPDPCVPLLPTLPKEICVTSLSILISGQVGGIAELPDVAGATPLEAADPSGGNPGLLAGVIAAAAAGILALGGAAWYARRRSPGR